MPSNNASVHEANKVLRVLDGKRLKFTCRVHCPDGRVIEWQSDCVPKVDWNNDTRSVWIVQSASESYGNQHPVMPFEPGMIILAEENPKA